jgi:putative hemolysin
MIWLELLVILGLVLLNGVFAMSELAMVSARRARLQYLADQGRTGAKTALALKADPTRFLSTVQVGITLIGVLAGAFGGARIAGALAERLVRAGLPPGAADTTALSLIVVLITYLSLILGELVPKRLALADAARIATRVARPMRLLSRAGAPIVWVLERSTTLVLRLLGQRAHRAEQVTEDEIRSIVAEGAASGVLHGVEREMIEGVMWLADRPVRSIMTPRVDVEWLDVDATPEMVRDKIAGTGHARFLVCRGRLDDIVGVVHTKDLAAALLRAEPLDLASLARPPLVMPERSPVLRLLERLRTATVHMAVVVDEYGSIEGIITPTDILSGIAGELPQGADDDIPEAVRREDGSWLIDGRLDLHAAERVLNVGGMADDHDYATLAGFVLWRLGRMPRPADTFEWRGYRFEVVDMDGRRIDKVLVTPPAAKPGGIDDDTGGET